MHYPDPAKSWKKQSVVDVAIAVFVLFLPFLSFLHLWIAEDGTRLHFFGWEFAHGFADNQVFIWFIFLHLSSFVFVLLILFFSKGFWRYLLLVPICYFIAYPIWGFHEESKYFSDFVLSSSGIFINFFVCFIVLIIDYFIKTRLVAQDIDLTFEAGCKEFFEAWNSRYNREIRMILQRKSDFSPKEYLQRIYYYSSLAERMEGMHFSAGTSASWRPSRLLDIALSGLLLVLLALLFARHWIPPNESSSILFGLHVGSFGFRDSSTFLFYASNKMVLCILGLVWFATCRYWWRWAILSPVLFYLYQFWEIFQSVKEIDGSGNLNVLPLALLTVIVIAFLWKLIRSISITRDYRQFLKLELDKNLEQFSREEIRNHLMQIQVHNPEVL